MFIVWRTIFALVTIEKLSVWWEGTGFFRVVWSEYGWALYLLALPAVKVIVPQFYWRGVSRKTSVMLSLLGWDAT